MAMEFIVEKIHEEIIKPSSPTPLHLKTSTLSLFDQVQPIAHVPLLFCYPNNGIAEGESRSHLLKKSLSETLTRFYPFAGRLSSSLSSMECNDEGVDYVETRVNCRLQDMLKEPDCESLAKLLGFPQMAATGPSPVIIVKVNFFECGGMAIGISFLHKVADVSTIKLFIKTWAAMARGSSDHAVPDFTTIPSLFPTISDFSVRSDDVPGQLREVAFRRLVFDASKIPMLKAQVASRDVPQPTRVEAVVALLWKCARAAATTNRAQTLDCETELQSLVKQLRDGMRDQFSESSMRKLQGNGAVFEILFIPSGSLLIQRDDLDLYMCSSWCGFELYESADFGWGKPRWVTVCIGRKKYNTSKPIPINFILMDSSDGKGIEARVELFEDEMVFFESNQELLAFASVNPCVKL
ncbi:Transferase [Corchorus capsularis]|uniref:Transferase n=1 Tax=Corchorus capsularis TaxID=210143 RepID=A0A1R3GQQ9_COCAP|nr:Transferase [Corchorus capsularis]